MDVRNLKFNEFGAVDCEINHPNYGWIPFTASPDDAEKFGRDIYAAAVAGSYGDISEYVAPAMSIEQVQTLRLAAYRTESDQLKLSAEYDAQVSGASPDYSAWIAAVQQIKARYPLPEA